MHASCCLLQKKSKIDKNAKEVDPLVPAFTRRREVFAGRLAMFGFAASLIGEVSAVLSPVSCGFLSIAVPREDVFMLSHVVCRLAVARECLDSLL